MTTTVTARLVAPTNAVDFAFVTRSVVLSNRDFVATLVRAVADDGSTLDVQEASWLQSASLGRPFAYLPASDDKERSFAPRLSFGRPVVEVVLEVLPWNARKAEWLPRFAWDSVRFSGAWDGSKQMLYMTGLAELGGAV